MKKEYMVLVLLLLVFTIALYFSVVPMYQKIFNLPETAPLFSMKDLAGKAVSLSDLKGKVIFLNFWAPRCDHSINQMPSMQHLLNRYHDKGLVILAVSIGEETEKVKKCLQGNKYSFSFFSDPRNDIARIYKVDYIPMNLLINKQGLIVFNEVGSRECDAPEFSDKIEKLL